MTELVADVLPWLFAFYVLDAIVQLRRGQWVFERDGLSGFTLLRHGLHAAALWPWGVSFVVYELPYLPGRDAIFLFDPDARQSPAVVRPAALQRVAWEALGQVHAVGGKVRTRDRLLFRARSPAAARAIAAELEGLRTAAPEAREALIFEAQQRGFDLRAARARWQKVRRPLAFTTGFAAAEAFALFVGLPWVAFFSTGEGRYERLFALLGLAHLGTLLAAAWTLHRAEVRAAERGGTLFMLAVFPAYAARAGAQVLRDAWWRWEAVAVAAAVCAPARFHRLARQELVRARESQRATEGLGLERFWGARVEQLERALKGESLEVALSAPPGASVCELCLSEYRAGFVTCADCGVPLRAA